jgi:hypothetical protein
MEDLSKLKKSYEHFQQKYKLPGFEALNHRFDIEKLADHETDMLVREVRRAIMEKAATYFKFIEIFINPSSAPMFFVAAIKRMNGIDRQPLEQLYVELGKLEVDSIELENSYDEKKEAEFIKKINEKWDSISKRFAELTTKMKKSFEGQEEKKEKSYFG